MTRKLNGWRPEPKDPRDLIFAARRKPLAKIQRSSDLEAGFPKTEDQRDTSSCVANTTIGLLEFLEIKNGVKFKDLSRMFNYWGARKAQDWQDRDEGCYIRDSMKFAAKSGTCHEELFGFEKKNLFREPPPEAWAQASFHKVTEYRRLTTLDEMLSCLSEGYPFGGGVTLFSSFDAINGRVPTPDYANESIIGGHAMEFAGHKTEEGELLLKLRNSWGLPWGVRGFAWVAASYVMKAGSDFWTIREMEDKDGGA